MKTVQHCVVLMIPLMLGACGGGGGVDDSRTAIAQNTGSGFYVPAYGSAVGDRRDEADLTSITSLVIARQGDGQGVINTVASLFPVIDGLVQIYAGQSVQLVSASRNACPSGVGGCDTNDSSALGVGTNALIANLTNLQNSIKNQGERGTCVGFALNASMEVLLARDTSNSASLSEQNTYFEGKRLENSWDSAGLVPYSTVSDFVNEHVKFVNSSSWPYNKADYNSTPDNCAAYWSTYGQSFTCSNTEAQGGGSDTHVQDATAASASGYTLQAAHQLYASIGRIKQALYRGYPVMVSVNANYDFLFATYKSGVVSWVFKGDNCGSSLCGHDVLVVGYQDDSRVDGGGYMIVKNSWGSSWGRNGMAYVTYAWLEHSLLDAQAAVAYAVDR